MYIYVYAYILFTFHKPETCPWRKPTARLSGAPTARGLGISVCADRHRVLRGDASKVEE